MEAVGGNHRLQRRVKDHLAAGVGSLAGDRYGDIAHGQTGSALQRVISRVPGVAGFTERKGDRALFNPAIDSKLRVVAQPGAGG